MLNVSLNRLQITNMLLTITSFVMLRVQSDFSLFALVGLRRLLDLPVSSLQGTSRQRCMVMHH
jgi:hypothetical protein